MAGAETQTDTVKRLKAIYASGVSSGDMEMAVDSGSGEQSVESLDFTDYSPGQSSTARVIPPLGMESEYWRFGFSGSGPGVGKIISLRVLFDALRRRV